MISKNNALVAAKIETAYGTAVTLAASDAMFVSDFTHKMIDGDVADRNNITGMLGAQGAIRTSQHDSIEFSVELAGSGSVGVAPRFGTLLQACGFAEIITAATNVIYAPISAGFKSLTMAVFYQDDAGGTARQLITGTRGTVSLDLSAGGIPMLKFSMTGLYNDPSAGVMLAGDFSGIPIPRGVNNYYTPSVSILGTSLPTSKITIDIGNEVKYRNLINLESVDILNRKGKVSVEVDMPTTADATAWVTHGKNNDQGAFSIIHGLTAGNIVTINVPNMQLRTVSPTWDGAVMKMAVDADVVPTAPNTDMTITFT